MKLVISALLLAVLAAPASALTSASQSTDGGVTIRPNVSVGEVLDPGDGVSFQYQSARNGALVVFDIDTQGYVTLLTDDPVAVEAHESGELPGDGSKLFAEGEPGVEFIFAVAVPNRDAIDSSALESLRGGNRQITGDPFIAANMIAGELVSNISQHAVFMGYTYFYVSERVEYPCYLCGNCDGAASKNDCEGYRVVQNFDRGTSLQYPLARGYDMVDLASNNSSDSSGDDVAMPSDDDVDVNFYPYGSEVHYADPVALNAWYDWGWYDPYYWYYPGCYPYYSYPGWSFSIGFGWGWGWGWGCGYPGYYCSGWYAPYYGCGYYPYYPSGGYGTVTPYKTKYKSNNVNTAASLSQNRSYAMKKDGNLRVASKGVRTTTTNTAYRSKSAYSGQPSTMSTHRVKTSVSGSRGITREAWSSGRNGSVLYKGGKQSSMYRTNGKAGKTVMQRGGYRSTNGGATQQYRGGNSRVKNGSTWAPRSSGYTRSKSTWSAPSTRSAPRSSGSSSPRMSSGYKGGGHSAPAYRGGSGFSGGGRSMGSTGGGMRSGGSFKGGGGRR
jgi:hypothetical protein